jgi:hypothetical protein
VQKLSSEPDQRTGGSVGRQAGRKRHRSWTIQSDADDLRIERQSKKSELREQAGGPSGWRVSSKPSVGRLVMRMVGPRQA